jgi:hypothetical protein
MPWKQSATYNKRTQPRPNNPLCNIAKTQIRWRSVNAHMKQQYVEHFTIRSKCFANPTCMPTLCYSHSYDQSKTLSSRPFGLLLSFSFTFAVLTIARATMRLLIVTFASVVVRTVMLIPASVPPCPSPCRLPSTGCRALSPSLASFSSQV